MNEPFYKLWDTCDRTLLSDRISKVCVRGFEVNPAMESENQALSQLSSGLVETWSSDHMKRPSSCIGHAILDNIGGIWDGHSMYWDSRWFCSFVIRESFCWVMGCGIIPLQADDLIYLILKSDLGHGHHVFYYWINWDHHRRMEFLKNLQMCLSWNWRFISHFWTFLCGKGL